MPNPTLYTDHFPWLNDSPEKVRANKLLISLMEDELCCGKQITNGSLAKAFVTAGLGAILEKFFYEEIKCINLRREGSNVKFNQERVRVLEKISSLKQQMWKLNK